MDNLNTVREKLDLEGKKLIDKMTKAEIIKLSRYTIKIYNNCCVSCKNKMLNSPAHVRNIDDLCINCQNKQEIIDAFLSMQRLYSNIK